MRKSISIVALAAAGALALAGCSGGGSPSTAAPTDGAAEMTALTVGVIPIVNVAPIYLGVRRASSRRTVSTSRSSSPRVAQPSSRPCVAVSTSSGSAT